jgi:signal transduction histidine kinase
MEVLKRELRVALGNGRNGCTFSLLDSNPVPSPGAQPMKISNMSRNGLFIEDRKGAIAGEGSAVQFQLHFDDTPEEVTGIGRVRWVRNQDGGPYQPRGVGIQIIEFFDNSEKRYFEFLENCLKDLTIPDLMDPNFISVDPERAVMDVIRAMNSAKASCVMVCDIEGAPLGIFTRSDLTRIAVRKNFLYETVGLHMTPGPFTVEVDQSLEAVYNAMRSGLYTHIPVLEDGIVVGMISTRNVVRHWSEFMDLQNERLSRAFDKAISVIAHDLRTPISIIQSTNLTLTSGEITPEEYVASGFPESMDQTCELMLRLIDDILDINRVKSGAVRLEYKLIDAVELVSRVVKSFQTSAGSKNIRLETRFDVDIPKLNADPMRIEQVLNNLISNAIKYSGEGSNVEIGVLPTHSRLEIWVADSGQGIDETEIRELFKEYSFISSRPTKGEKSNGLGLAIVRKLVEAHGGDISVTSKKGVGSRFTVSLPISLMQ